LFYALIPILLLLQGGYIYSRLNNFTCDSAQAAINAVEGGKGTLVFNTGMSAISTALFCFLQSGDHIVSIYRDVKLVCRRAHVLFTLFVFVFV
jgi:cystathionine beta-lyase/cystathionine gamma-synthase